MNKLFTRVSTEEDDTYVSGQDTSIDEIISRQAAEDEFNEIAAELEDDIEAVEEADERIVELEEVVTGCEALLDNPSQVTAAHVLVAQETLRMTGVMLGTDLEDTISLETATESPVTALELSVEGIKDFINKVIEQVKAIFKKIMLAAKKLFVKATQMLMDNEKQAKKLIENIKDLKDKPAAKFDEKQNKSFKATYGIIGALNGHGTAGALDIKAITKYVNVINDTKQVNGVIKFSEAIQTAYTTGITDPLFKKQADGLANSLETLKTTLNYDQMPEMGLTEKKGLNYFIPVKYGEKTVNGLGISFNGSSPEYSVGFMRAITFTKISITIDNMQIPDIKVLSVNDIKTILGLVASKTNKDFSKAITNLLTTNDKVINTIEKTFKEVKNPTSDGKTIFVKFISFARTTVSSYALDAVIGQVTGSRRVIGFCNACVKAHK